MRFDGIAEFKKDSCSKTEDIVKDTLRKTTGIRNIQIERTHHVRDKNKSTYRAIVAKFSHFKIKDRILEVDKKQNRDRYLDLSRLFKRIC